MTSLSHKYILIMSKTIDLKNHHAKPISKELEKYASELAGFTSGVMQRQYEAEEKCVTKVLREYLKKEPTNEDFKNCIRMFDPKYKMKYILCYKNVTLGCISHSFNCTADYNGTFTVTFNPDITSFDS